MVREYNTTILTMIDLRTKTLSRQSMTTIKRLIFAEPTLTLKTERQKRGPETYKTRKEQYCFTLYQDGRKPHPLTFGRTLYSMRN